MWHLANATCGWFDRACASSTAHCCDCALLRLLLGLAKKDMLGIAFDLALGCATGYASGSALFFNKRGLWGEEGVVPIASVVKMCSSYRHEK